MRVVSLVPSLTEAVAVSAPGLLVGATDWCDRPASLDVVRVKGTKNPDIPAVLALRPDLVIANEEENREPDLAALRAAGANVLVTEVRDLDQAFRELERVLVDGCGLARPRWLDDARRAWDAVRPLETAPAAVVPIWRRPWMVLGRDTFAGDLLARLGVRNLYADHPERYPRIPLGELRSRGARLVILPDEPYRFTADDGPEAFPGLPPALLSGRHLTWYGPSLGRAPDVIGAALRTALRRPPPAPSATPPPPTP
ncbi:helical backbone metal receptor [Streptomyces sp. NPDC014894]|uniref:helical backbone metal receptor n=1 Tax=unclassified Streptomyces TaxID=2593676 RepID=UPI003701EEE3